MLALICSQTKYTFLRQHFCAIFKQCTGISCLNKVFTKTKTEQKISRRMPKQTHADVIISNLLTIFFLIEMEGIGRMTEKNKNMFRTTAF